MALTQYREIKNGNYGGKGFPARRLTCSGTGPFGFIPFGNAGMANWAFHIMAGFTCPSSDEATLTKTNSGTIGIAAGGLALVSGATSGNNTTLQHLRAIAPAADKRFAFVCRMNWTVVAKGKGVFGLMNTAADPIATPATDGVFFSKDTAGTGAIKSNLVGNSTAVTPVAVHTAVLATDYEYGLLYTPIDANDGYCDFWYRAAGASDWTFSNRMTGGSGAAPQAALRATMNITATDANALTATYPWYGIAMEL